MPSHHPIALLFLLPFAATLFAATEPPGAALYQSHCAVCHDAATASRIPSRATLAKLPPGTITAALTTGLMKQQGSGLTAQQRADVANWLSAVAPTSAAVPSSNNCPANQTPSGDSAPGWTNWGDGFANQRYQPNPGLTAQSVPKLKLQWSFGVPGVQTMRSQPIVHRGRLYLGTDAGAIVSLDARTGCQYWSARFKNVRSALTLGQAGPTESLFFGDVSGVAHAVDLATGTELWQTKVADHLAAFITGAPAYADGRLYVPLSSYEEVIVFSPGYQCCSFRGSVSSLDAATGKILWRTYTIDQKATEQGKNSAGTAVFGPSGAPVWSSPTLDPAHGVIYITTGDNYSDPATTTSDSLHALDLKTGEKLWSKQFTTSDVFNLACGKPGVGACKNGIGPDLDFGSSPMLIDLANGKRAVLLGQKSGMVYSVDPDAKGEILWQARVGAGGSLGGVQWGPASDGKIYYVAVSDIHFRKSNDPAHLAADPTIGGGLSAFDIASGKLLWKAAPPVCGDRPLCSPAQSAAVTAIDGAVFSGSLDGHIRAYASRDGAVIWDFDTERAFDTLNHVPAEGGSLDVSGPIIAGGMVYVLSGYPQYGGKGGNVLLAFAPN